MTEYAHPIITELLPKPTTGNEWVEIYNPTTEVINLSGWTLNDQLSQPSLIYTFAATTIAPGATLVVEVGKKLNDTGDGVTLIDTTGQPISTTSYSSTAPADLSWTRLSLSSEIFDWQTTSPGLPPPLTFMPSSTPTFTPTTIPTPTIPPATSTPRPSPKPSPSLKPSPTGSSRPNQITTTPTTNPVITANLQARMLTQAQISTSPTPPRPSPRFTTSTQSALSAAAAQPPDQIPAIRRSRQVYFPDWRSVPAIHNVIIGGLILAVYNGFLIWFDWQQSQLIEL